MGGPTLIRPYPVHVAFCAAILLAGALAGCFGSPVEPSETVTAAFADANRALNLTSAPGDAPDERSLESPPEWRTGEWWRYKFTDLATGEVSEVTKVVVGRQGDRYLVGMPADAWDPRYLVYHLPGFTEVNRSDLSFEVHDAVFKPLQFPLVNGASWQTGWHQRIVSQSSLLADVEVTGPTTADVLLVGPGGHVSLTYNATMGQIARFTMEDYVAWEIVDHGCCFEGDVRLTLDQDVDILSIRGALVVTNGLGPAGPVETVQVDTPHSHITLATLIYDDLVGGPAVPVQQGVAGLRVHPPQGASFEHVTLPTDGPGTKVRYHDLANPAGTWTFEHVAAGNVATLAEGLTYDGYVVTLPEGTVAPLGTA